MDPRNTSSMTIAYPPELWPQPITKINFTDRAIRIISIKLGSFISFVSFRSENEVLLQSTSHRLCTHDGMFKVSKIFTKLFVFSLDIKNLSKKIFP